MAIALGAGVGCSEPKLSQGTAPELGKGTQLLAGYGVEEWAGPVYYWDHNDYEVPVCYLANVNNTGSEADYFADFVNALAEVEEVAGLSFHWDGPCASISEPELAAYVPVIFNDQWDGGNAAPGFGKRRTTSEFPVEYQVGLGTQGTFEKTSVHEMLHALGFMHEQQRIDSQATCPAALVANGNNTPEPYADRLTLYDSQSVMNYCRTDSGSKLTPLDRAGLGVVYPKTYSRTPHADFAFRTGSGLLSRAQGYAYSDWIHDGVLDWVINSAMWTNSGFALATGPRLSLSGYAGTTLQLGGWFVDFMGRVHSIETTPVIIDNSKHTALLAAALM